MKRTEYIGWILGALTALCWALYAIIMRIGSTYFETIHPTVFILQSLIIGAFGLLIVSGMGRLSLSTIRNAFTWQYGTLQIINNAILMAAFSYAITSTSATLLLRSGIVISALLNMFLQGHSEVSSKKGLLLLVTGLALVVIGLEGDGVGIALFFVFISAFAQVLQVRVASSHKESIEASGDIKTELRVTGYILAITALVYGVFMSLGVFVGASNVLPGFFPTKEAFFSLESIGLAAFTGLFIISSMKYFEFTSTKYIGSTNFLTIVAFTPFLTFLMERLFIFMDILDASDVSFYEAIGGFCIIGAVLLLVRSAIYNKKTSFKSKEENAMEVAKERIEATLTYFNGDEQRTQEALGLDAPMCQAILEGHQPYHADIVEQIKDRFNDHVSMRDPVTGLQNRLMFMTNLSRLLKETSVKENLVLFYLDLNKFKPINDTYGHAAGDVILKEVGYRLHNAFCGIAEVCRLGGDEYALAMQDAKGKEDYLKSRIESIVCEEIALPGINSKVSVGVSVGYACAKCVDDAEKLLKQADEKMYKEKEAR